MSWMTILSAARSAAKMVGARVPYYMLDQWGLKLEDEQGRHSVVSFAELVERGIKAVCLVRVAGGFYEDWGYAVSPNGREASGGWQQTGRVALPEGARGQVAIVVDRTGSEVKVLVEFREEALATELLGQIVASSSAVASKSNLTGGHGYSGNKTYIALLRDLRQLHTITTHGDTARDVKTNEVIILDWVANTGHELPDLSHEATGKFYAWCTMDEIAEIAKEGIISSHFLEALGLMRIMKI